jgi:hypothetical protein
MPRRYRFVINYCAVGLWGEINASRQGASDA